jgi:hypothetical protein
MEKILNFFKRPAIATFFTVVSGSLLLLVYWIPAVDENFYKENLWKSVLITVLYRIGLWFSVQKRSYRLLYLWVVLTVPAIILSGYILTHGLLIADKKYFLLALFSFTIFFLPSVSVMSAAMVKLLGLLNRNNKHQYYLRAGGIGAGLAIVCAISTVIIFFFLFGLCGGLD